MMLAALASATLAGYQVALIVLGIKMEQDKRLGVKVTISVLPGFLSLALAIVAVALA